MPQYPELHDRTVIITGGANGIGAAMVHGFVEHGARVHFCDVDTTAARKLARDLAVPGAFRKVNLLSENQITRWIKGIGLQAGRIDVLVNNAAADPRSLLEKTTARDWDRLFARNLRAYFITCREAVPWMFSGSSIINLSSITIHTGPAGLSAYVGTKAGILGFSRSLARELGPRGIRVNVISPGWVMTERQLRQFVTPATKKLIRNSQCIPELIQPPEIASVALFLACQASQAITGQEILVDRGWAHS